MSNHTLDTQTHPPKEASGIDPLMQEIEQLTQEGRHIVEAEEKGKKLVEAVEKLGEASRLL